MTLQAIMRHKQTKAALVGAVAALLGWQLCWLPLGQFLTRFSFDFPFIFSTPASPTEIVLVELDEISHTELKQTYGQRWDRRLHAKLLDRLRAEGAGVVVFDMTFTEADDAADEEFARAIAAHGRVVLAAEVSYSRNIGGVGGSVLPPTDTLRAATKYWGPTEARRDGDDAVRKLYTGTEQKPPLAWVAAALANEHSRADLTDQDHLAARWIRYYGPGGTLTRISYSQVENQAAGFFRGKTVFIGGRPKTRFVTDEVDEFVTPWRLHGQPQISGLELVTTEFLNLSRGDFLHRMTVGQEIFLLALFGLLAGAGLACARPLSALLLAAISSLLVTAAALYLFFEFHLWFNWAVTAFVQIPFGLAWSLGLHWWNLKKEKDWLESPLPDLWDDLPADRASAPAPATVPLVEGAPAIPDHTMLRLVGRGAYGDVWLARDVLGNFHAVKIVRRVAFDHAGPYEREFRGLQNITPVSRAHPGLVHILHVGRGPADDYFYYVMEAGDDEKSGSTIDPTTYTPRNLGRDLLRRAPFPPAECIEIIGALCEALEFLHGRGLIHRDIKPANIIFVNGRPKLADVGLVAEVSDQRPAASMVGTEGYLPPEGPGTAAGDVFALGRVLEEMLRPRQPTDAPLADAAHAHLRAIIRQACAATPAERFASASAMREALGRCVN